MVILKVLILQIVALSIYNTKDKVHTCSKKMVYFCLPSLDIMVYISVHNLVKFLLLLIHIFSYVCFRPSCRFSNVFPCKDRISIALRSHVVYQFTCQCCSALYVGQTRRHIHTRISEHMKVSPLTGKNALSPPCLVYSLPNTCRNTQSPLLISKSYHVLLSGIFSSLKAY